MNFGRSGMPAKNFEPQEQKDTTENTDNSEVQPQPVRELTQTDKLNKRLLISFLERINESGMSLVENFSENVNSNDTENEFA